MREATKENVSILENISEIYNLHISTTEITKELKLSKNCQRLLIIFN